MIEQYQEIKSDINILVTFNIVANKCWQEAAFLIKDSKNPMHLEGNTRGPSCKTNYV